ncbi:carboxypeptidase regulatory-like domain-containing protein [Candidatus Woesearchaeota archaeon]|nr:carboxypeptidase regulatory-like domain-containing protein [Candidatus Woesearchaeota archaeon]
MKLKATSNNNFVHYSLLFLLIALAILGLVLVKKFTGFAGTQLSAEGGTITSVFIDDRSTSSNWAGAFGLVFSQSEFNEEQSAILDAGTITSVTLVFECQDPSKSINEMYAIPNSTMNFTDLRAGSTKMIDEDFLNLSNSTRDRANNTFLKNESILLGTTNISGIPAVYTYVSDAPNNSTFFTGILNSSGRLAMVIKVFSTSQINFKGTKVDYQSLLPIRNSTTKWYFFADPNDECPAGFGSGQLGDSVIDGYVFESNATAVPLPNVTVSAGGNSSVTDSNGHFNFTIPGGVVYQLIGIKEGYLTNITTINTTIGATTLQNLTMAKFNGFLGPNSTIFGYARDNSTGAVINNVTINVAASSMSSNETGNFSFTVPAGTYIITAIKTGYDNFIGNFSVSDGINITYLINMTAAASARDSFVNGFVIEAGTAAPIPNATVSAGGNSSLTGSSGFFNLTIAGGFNYSLVAIKEGFNTNITTINTTIGQTTVKNLTMSRFIGFLSPNSTVFGYVKDNSTNATIENATISVAGLTTLSNATGNFSFSIPEGTYVIAAIKNGYQNFVGNFSISSNNNLTFAINMTLAVSAGAAAQNGTLLTNGTIQGFVKDSSTNSSLENVTVTVAGESNITNSAGFYNITALQGTTNLVATKSGYNNYFAEVNITANNITVYNFSMSTVTVAAGVGNGSVNGLVKTSSGSVLSSVTVTVAGRSNTSNSAGEYSLSQIPAGTHNLVATRTGFNNYVASINVTEGAATGHNITMTTTTEAGLGAGSGAGKGAGQGSGKGAGQGPGRGAGTGIPAQIQQPTKVVDYEISIKRIIKKLRVGNFLGTPIDITNFKDDSIELKFSFEGDIKKLARIDKERLVIDGGATGTVTVTLLGNVEPGVYEGSLVVSGDINEQIPMYILVLEKERLSVESLIIKITPADKKISAGSLFKYTVDLQNLLSEEKYKVSLSYNVQGITNNRSLFLEKEEIVIHTSFSLLKNFRIPNDMPTGDYALKVKADFLDLSAEQSTIFVVSEPLYKYAVLGVLPLWLLAVIVGTLSAGTFSVVVYKKKKEEKKRYKIDIDYSQLPKAGPRSAFVGNIAETHNKAYFDLDLFQVHTLIAGASGSGKSIVAQDLVEEALLKGVAVIVFDPTAQWTGFLRRCEDKKLINLYKNYGMKKTDARAFNGNVHLVTNGREIIDFHKFMKSGEINIFVTNKLDTKDIELFVSTTIKQVFHAHLPESKELKYLMIYDGIHSLLPKFGGSGQVFVQIERATREFRKWGVGLILVSQVLSDFPPEVLANINTEIQLRTRDEGDLSRTKEKYGENILQSVVKAALGAGVVQNSAYNKGKPYFIGFRPPLHGTQRINDEELEKYNKYNEMIDDLEFQLEQLEKESVDVFDLKLELKLSQDKVKSGNFNMVNIYLDGLKPRIKSQWDKLGKAPQKKEVKYYDDSELEEELERAKEERKKENQKTEESSKEENLETQKALDELAAQIAYLVNNNEKQKAVSMYAQVQEIYRNAPKDAKAKILTKCIEIQKILNGA